MTAPEVYGIGARVHVVDGDGRLMASGRVAGVATWWTDPATFGGDLVRGYVVALGIGSAGWLAGDEGRPYVSALVADPSSLRPAPERGPEA